MEATREQSREERGQAEEGPPPSAAKTALRRLGSRWLFFSVAITGGLLDLWTKSWAFRLLDADASLGLTPDKYRSIIPGVLRLKATVNPGSLGGIFQGYPTVLLIVTSCISLLLLWIAISDGGRSIGMQLALGLFSAGAIGNLTDRIYYGHVRDFLDLYHGSRSWWPTFNLADACICVGAGVFLLVEWRRSRGAAAAVEGEPVISEPVEDEGR